MSTRIRTSYIDGAWLEPTRRVVSRENPGAPSNVATRFCAASPQETKAAMSSAARSFPDWSKMPVNRRIRILSVALDLLDRHHARIVKAITNENGKTLADSKAEVTAALNDAHHHLRDARKVLKANGPNAVAASGSTLRRESVGVYALITPWNFPLATILRKLVPALAFGNTVVVKPSELTSGVACDWFEILASAGLPAGVANLVLGKGKSLGPSLIEHETLRGISFTGSTENGLSIAKSVGGRDVRLQIEMGGKNSLLVLADADLDAAAEAAAVAGFGCGGQWCTGTGRVIVEASVADVFCAKLVDRAKRIVVGPGRIKRSQVGALISKDRVAIAKGIVTRAVEQGARLACGGTIPKGPRTRDGYFFEPTVLTEVTESMDVFMEELFVPILPVTVAEDFEDGLRLSNKGQFGLSASIFTTSKRKGTAFCRSVEAGIVHCNLHTAHRASELPVAAWRDSGRGVPECGDFAKDFFTKPRAIYTKF